jgi:hypothetical protein
MFPLECALLAAAVRACLLVLLCRVYPTNFLTQYQAYPAYPAVDLVSDTRVRGQYCLVYMLSNHHDVAGMM